jgi:hypothetical protein
MSNNPAMALAGKNTRLQISFFIVLFFHENKTIVMLTVLLKDSSCWGYPRPMASNLAKP